MPIAALPPATIRLLGSPLVITTPISLVKELIENSIDAGATSIEVLISQDTIESVEVRDNGRGIHPTDFDSLGRRGHTSKLRTFDEIKTIGGRTLGFRGEALASANVLAKVIVTTRTSAEPVAAKLHLLDTGGVAKQELTSAPVGTSVKISGLFRQLPVRRQTAVKEAAKTIPKIKELLQSHALARLGIKYSFKVLGRPKLSWSYNPGKQVTVREAVLRVFGPELASQCVEVTTPEATVAPKAPLSPDPQQTAEYAIETFLPKPDADLTMISKSAFVYIDSRPVSSSRGTAKKLVSMFRTHLNRKSSLANSIPHLKDPFIRINIHCSLGSYDPNIEPSKDDVLFVDEPILLEKFDALLLGVYPPPSHCLDAAQVEGRLEQVLQKATEASTIPTCGGSSKSGELRASQDASHDLINMWPSASASDMENKLGPHMSCTSAEQDQIKFQFVGKLNTPHTHKPQVLISQLRPRQAQIIRTNHQHHLPPRRSSNVEPTKTNQKFEEDPNFIGSLVFKRPRPQGSTEAPMEERPRNPHNGLNPWAIAELNSSRYRLGPDSQKPFHPHAPMDNPLGKMFEQDSRAEVSILRPPGGVPRDLELPPMQQIRHLRPNTTSKTYPESPYRCPISTPTRMTGPLASTATIGTSKDWGLQSPPPSIAPRAGHTAGPWPRRDHPQRPGPHIDFRTMDQTRLDFQTTDHQTKMDFRENIRPRHLPNQSYANTRASEGSCLAAGAAWDRVVAGGHTTTTSTRGAVDRARSAGTRPLRHEGHTPRRCRAPHPQASAARDKGPQGTGLHTSDPRGHLVRRPHPLPGTTRRTLKRANTELLPLETPSQETHTLMQTVSVDTGGLTVSLNTAAVYDTYVGKGTLEEGLDKSMGSAEVSRIENRLRQLLATRAADLGTDSQIELNLLSGLKGKSRQT